MRADKQSLGAGHKIAVAEIPDGAPVSRYGQIIGFAQGPIAPGAHVHTHNVVMKEFGRDYHFCADAVPINYHAPENMRYFQGFLAQMAASAPGQSRDVAAISSVNCSASVSHYVRDRFRTEEFKRDFPNVDGVIAFTQKGGCAIDPGEPQAILQRVLAGIARHPNISGYVMIGLGCETNQIDAIRASQKLDLDGLNCVDGPPQSS